MGFLDFFRFNTEKRDNGQNFLRAHSVSNLGQSSGVAVTRDSSLTFSAVYACVRIISESIASLPINVYLEEADGDRILQKNHPVQKLLAKKPNNYMTSYTFKDVILTNLLLEGNAYFLIVRDGSARPIELICLDPSKVEVYRHEGQLYYKIEGEDSTILQDDMLHFVGLSFDGLKGRSVLNSQRATIGTSIAANVTAGNVLGNTTQVGGIIKHPGKLSAEAIERLRTSWNNTYQGPFAAGKTAILEEGMTFEPSKINAQDRQLLESRRFQVEEIARIFKVPLSLIGHLEKAANYSSIEALSIDFVRFTLTPYIVSMEEEMNRKLFRENEQDEHYVKIQVEGLLRGDSNARANFYKQMIDMGVLSINEVRKLENLNRIENGDTHYFPMNYAPIGQSNQGDND
jgi:HK97 family phage portal protein